MTASNQLTTDDFGWEVGLKTNSTFSTAAATVYGGLDTALLLSGRPSRVDDASDPSGNIIWNPLRGNSVDVRFWMAGADNSECRFLILLEEQDHKTLNDSDSADVYTITPIITIDATASAYVGIAGGTLAAADRCADTLAPAGIVGTTGVWDTGIVRSYFSPENNIPGVLRLDHRGARRIGIYGDPDGTGGTACTSWNAEIKCY